MWVESRGPPGKSSPRPCKTSPARRSSRRRGNARPPAPSLGCQLAGACELSGCPEGQGGSRLMRRPKSRCPPTGSDRGTRFPFRIKRVFPFFFSFLFSAWQAEGFLNWSWRSSIRSVTKLAQEDTEENSPPRPKEAPAPALRRVKRARPPPAGEKGAFFPLSTASAGCSQSGFVVPGICRAEGVWRLSVHSGLRGGFSQTPVGSLHPHPQHTQWLPCRSLYRFLKAHLSAVRFCGNQQPLLRAPTAQRAATCGNKLSFSARCPHIRSGTPQAGPPLRPAEQKGSVAGTGIW